jgi:hypothetical protein
MRVTMIMRMKNWRKGRDMKRRKGNNMSWKNLGNLLRKNWNTLS